MKPWALFMACTFGVALMSDASAHGGAGGYRGHAPVYRSAPVVRVRPSPVIVYGWGVPYGAWWHGWPGSPATYYGPAVVGVPASPPVYVEQGAEASGAPVAGYWYWCAEPHGYFPDVRDCPVGWQAVMPRVEQKP